MKSKRLTLGTALTIGILTLFLLTTTQSISTKDFSITNMLNDGVESAEEIFPYTELPFEN